MTHSKYEQTLALAGIYQAASLVKQIANTGKANSAHIESSLETLFRFDADSVEQVYGSIAGVSHGIKVLHQHLVDRASRDIEITKYALSLIMLEKKLAANTNMLEEISKRLNKIESQFDFFSLSHDNTIAKLGQIYKETISTLGPRIIVTGEQPYLSSESNASKVRALLLAGIRSAVLWRQCGGSRWQFLFGRKAYIAECENILARL
ncbi:MAG: high frequency lysogenization protein HflD [Gammaproteobacteria bacterium]|nr:high frequency lysogenization protein HflD [Gammaproteobacteria bacterium]MBT8134600.1 high frequency lysogenization protein HflD [Gammaproteobacteria bacterium]NNJ49049.1 high frequency lysogenization protein HflD [Gammaproteobacteria bacterium]